MQTFTSGFSANPTAILCIFKLCVLNTGWPGKKVPNFCMSLCNKSAEKHVSNEETSSNMSFYMYINEFSPTTPFPVQYSFSDCLIIDVDIRYLHSSIFNSSYVMMRHSVTSLMMSLKFISK